MVKLILSILFFVSFSFAALVNSVTINNPQIPVTQSGIWAVDVTDNFLSDAQLRSSPLAVNVQNYPAVQDVNITGGTVTVIGALTDSQLRASAVPVSIATIPTHAVTQSGSWNTGRTWTLASSTDSTSAVITSMPAITGTVSISGTPTIANTAFGISGSLPSGTNAIGSITNTVFGSTQSGIWNVGLSTGSNVIGSISNTGFGITGTLPSFASTQTFNIGTGAFFDRTTAAAPYSNRLSDGTAFYDARSIRALTSSDVVTVANPTTSVSITGSVAVTGPLTDAQLRAAAVPISGAVTSNIGTTNGLALDSSLTTLNAKDFATQTTLALIKAKTDNIDVALSTRTKPADTQTISGSVTVTSAPAVTGAVTANAGTNLNTSALNLETTQSALNGKIPSGLTVKAASTAAAAADQALVVAISPNNTLPVSVSGVANAANQATEISSLSSIATNTANTVAALTAALPAGTNSIGQVTSNAGTNLNTSLLALDSTVAKDATVNTLLKPASTLTAVTTVGTVNAVTAITNALPTGANKIGTVDIATAPATAKGTQGLNGLPTQDLKDAGRVSKMYSSVFTAAVTEAMVTLTPISDGTAAATNTTFGVTAGKKLRIQQVCVSTRNAGAAGQGVVIQLRMTSTGAVTATSNLVGTIGTGSNLAIANAANSDCMMIPDGFELSGTQQFGVSQIGTATANNTVVVYGFEY